MQTQVSTHHTNSAIQCPICQAMMGVTVVEGAGELDKIRYVCRECGVEMQHTYERHRDERAVRVVAV